MMTSLLHQLENNEAILLMYLADELPAEDRADVEQMLSNDASLRAELEELRQVQGGFDGGMERLDADTRLPVSEAVAVRRATRMLRQWQVDHVMAPPEEEPIKELRFPWWSYPLTTAAAVLIAFLVWWGNRGEQVGRPSPNYAQDMPMIGPVDYEAWSTDMVAADLQASFEISDEELLRMAMNAEVDAAVQRLRTPEAGENSL